MKRWIKRFSFIILCFLCLFTLYSYNIIAAPETNSVVIEFNNTDTSYDSNYFTVTLSSNLVDGKLTTGNTITVASKTVDLTNYYISSIKVEGEIEKLLCSCDLDINNNRDGIIDYSTSLIEYINGATKAILEAESDATITKITVTYTVEHDQYAVFNLAKGSVSIYASTCSGQNLANQPASSVDTTKKEIYVVQTKILDNGNLVRDTSYINSYGITCAESSKITTKVVLDNIWCTYNSGDNGGLHVPVSSTANAKNITVRLKGINRFTRISYWASSGHNSSLKFTSFYGDNDLRGTLLVMGKQKTKGNSVHGVLSNNGWNSVIGGTDSKQDTYGLKFAGGTIYAVATAMDQCTAIGAGGNGGTSIDISGGSVTAIAYTTGTAIGGGIGHLSAGGSGNVKITGGEVHAYNLGQPYALTCSGDQIGNRSYRFVPGTAIGGASSYQENGAAGTVTIEGGKVYAYSNGGSGLGGGNSILKAGGTANININGGDVTSYGYIPEEEAQKIHDIVRGLETYVLGNGVPGGIVEGLITDELIAPYNYGSNGAGIGGGSGQKGNGGTATININGGYLDASSIGGGNSQNSYGASATVTVTGGTTKCETIGGGFSTTHGYADGTVTVTGGSLNATMSALPTNGKSNEMLYLTRVSVLDGADNPITHSEIKELTTTGLDPTVYPDGYGVHEMKTDDEGVLYIWLTKGAAITNGRVIKGTQESPLKPYEEADSMISAYEIGILKVTDNKLYNYYVHTVTSEYYTLYNSYDGNKLSGELKNTTIVPNNTLFTVYVSVKDGYTVHAYYAVEAASGKKTFQQASTTNVDTNLLSTAITITQNTSILFEIIGPNDFKYFVMDLYNGNINVTEDDNGLIIEQNGYLLTGYSGGIYATTGGIATSNTISVEINKEVDLLLNNIIIGSDNSCISVNKGTVNLETGSTNDIINSNNSSAIFVDEGATLIINTNKDDALQLRSGDDKISPISGKGKVVFNNGGGFFKIITNNQDTPQISVGIYEFSGKNAYTAELYIGEFEFELIGYLDKNNELQDVSVSQTGNTENFAARGVFKVLEGIICTSDSVTGNNYVANLKAENDEAIIETIELTCGSNTLVAGTDYEVVYSADKKTCTLTIFGASFIPDNIMIFGAVEGKIPYKIINFDGVYDGKEHTISIALNTDKFDIYFSTTEVLTKENILKYIELEIAKPECPKFTNVGEYTIYIYICKSENNTSDLNYEPVQDVTGTVNITKGTNEWESQLVCPDVALGHNPNPFADSKWGIVKYEYFDENGNDLDADFKFIRDAAEQEEVLGTYYVRAYVDADTVNGNYDELVTEYLIRFKVIKVSTFTHPSRLFTKASGTAKSFQINPDGAFTVLYSITYSQGLSINVSNSSSGEHASLPVGTKITFIDFSTDVNNGLIKYYYYVVKDTDISSDKNNININLSEFISMGTNSTNFVAPSDDIAVEYQFSIDFEDGRDNHSGQIEFTLTDTSANDYDDISVGYLVNFKEEITVTRGPVSNQVEYTINVNANDTSADQVLVVELQANDYTGLSVALYNDNILVNPNKTTGNLYFYKLAENTALNKEYKFVVTNSSYNDQNIKVIFDVRNAYAEIPYVLENEDDSNHIELELELSELFKTKIVVHGVGEDNSDSHLITNDKSYLEVYFSSNEKAIIPDYFELVLYKKVRNEESGDQYEIVALPRSLQIIQSGNNYRVDIPTELENGTYRIEFKYKGSSCLYSFIIDK